MLRIEAREADATGGEPIFAMDGEPVGQVSSGAYGYSVEMSLAMAYLRCDRASAGAKLQVAILGRLHDAEILAAPPFDPEGRRLRA